MNVQSLHIVDKLYLKIVYQNVIHELLNALTLLKQHHRQSEELAQAKELPPEFILHYREVSERLGMLVFSFGVILDELETEFLCSKNVLPTEEILVQRVANRETQAVIERLDTAESDILNVVSDVGERLAGLPNPMMPWHNDAFFSVHVRLKNLQDRPCYDLDKPITFRSVSFSMAGINSPTHHDYESGQWPHYLVQEIMLIDLMGMIDNLWMEMDPRAEGHASWMTQERDHFRD